MAKKNLRSCRTHDDFCSYARKHEGILENGGRHTKIYGPKGGMVPVPRHKGDLAKGTRYSIIKMLAIILPVVIAVLSALFS